MAILVALAMLAERAACRSFPVRWLVLALLRRAEAVAWAFAAQETGCAWPFPEGGEPTGCTPADARLLAARLRLLSALLAALHSPLRHLAGGGAPLPDDRSGLPAPGTVLLLLIPGRHRARANDTS